MNHYTLALNHCGSLQFVLDVDAPTLQKARHEWARLTGHLDPVWDEVQGTYFGWPVVKTKLKALQRKEPTGYLSY